MNLESLLAEAALLRQQRATTPEAVMDLVLRATGDKELACREAAKIMEAQATHKAGG